MNTKILDVINLHKNYDTSKGNLTALNSFSLSVPSGEVMGLLGPNGSGKSSLVKMILSLVQRTSGTIEVFGKDIGDRSYLKNVGAIIEGNRSVNERLSTLENAKYYCRLRECSFDQSHFDQMVSCLELSDVSKPCRFLSTGNKQKAAIVCALIHKPKLVLLDEPTLGLDAFATEALLGLIKQQTQEHHTSFLISSHDFDFIQQSCNRLTVIKAGNKVFEGKIHDMQNLSYSYKISVPKIMQPTSLGLVEAFKRQESDSGWFYFVRSINELKTLLDFAFLNGKGNQVSIETFELKNQYMGLFK